MSKKFFKTVMCGETFPIRRQDIIPQDHLESFGTTSEDGNAALLSEANSIGIIGETIPEE